MRLSVTLFGTIAVLLGADVSSVRSDDLRGMQQAGIALWQSQDSIWLAAFAFVLQSAFIAYLLVERRKRMRAEQSLEIAGQQSAAAIDRLHLMEHRYSSILDDIGEQLVSLQEEERRRIAAELHDSTAQHLVAIELLMMRMRTVAQQTAGADTILDQMKSSLKEAQRELRIFTYLLHPPDLWEDGLKTALERFIEGFEDRTGIVAQAQIGRDIDAIPYPMQRSILRIAQEALANVHRHAQANIVTVKLTLRQGRVDLRVGDNGRGIAELSGSAPRHGVGIPGMRARARHFGGDVKLFSGRRGTLVAAMIPCESLSPDRMPMQPGASDIPERQRAAS
ncbi:MAG: histidine kinase [Steroidobacteraceae bacterium]